MLFRERRTFPRSASQGFRFETANFGKNAPPFRAQAILIIDQKHKSSSKEKVMPTKKKATKKKVVKKATKKKVAKKATKKKVAKKAAKKAVKKATKKKVVKKATKKKVVKKATKKKVVAKKPKVKRKPNAAFMAPMTPSAELAKVIGAKPLPRTEVTKSLWAYIKKNGLQDKMNRRNINADMNLRPIFGKAQVSMFEMTKLVSKHLKK
jgi:upstream activation factor subunit UAF30